ncbi:hypothetical protein ADL22_12740 [Streptomyces sp. NRRL F-4489]|uniref:Lsr2 dimerization domain-containing protein n=1 Tax=Streptomyces sp. NRRL F-4489 TaxID=1609095 RepID=UPI000749E244|nr:histone-like nucleoid-structuring protein Lsr2 [Streptomyces sp. NRRL F-4489]KUL44804.1 hypothetical protein ADL22_12740 [Streptomyces sp. NRRL F-4489]
MAVKETVQVDEAEKDQPGVQKVIANIPVGNQVVEKATYWRPVLQDDVSPHVTEGVRTIKFSSPAWVEEEYETGETNEDGTAKIGVRQVLDTQWYEIDLGEENVAALQEVLKPFTGMARKVEAPAVKPARKRRSAK